MTLLFSGAPAYAQSQHDLLRAQLIDLITQLIEQLQNELEQTNEVIIEQKNTLSKKEQALQRLADKKSGYNVDGYNAKGSNGSGAEVVFELDLDGDSDNDGIVIEDLMANILFEVKDPTSTRTGETLADMAGDGYIVTIEDGDEDAITPTTNFVIDGSETVVITIEVNATTLGLNGDFEVELTEIQWKDWNDINSNSSIDGGELGTEYSLVLKISSDSIYLEEQV